MWFSNSCCQRAWVWARGGAVGLLHGLGDDDGDGFADMRFNVDAVPSENFTQWVASTRSAGPVLDTQAYADLVKPSKAVAPFTYRSITPGLFAGILSAELQPDEALCVTYPGTIRAER